jgi:hypothetical protein
MIGPRLRALAISLVAPDRQRVSWLYRRPVARYSLPGDNVFPEGITGGAGTTFYVGSMGDGTIFRGDAEREQRTNDEGRRRQ